MGAAPSRIETCFENLKAQKRAGLVTFVTAGDPNEATSLAIINKLAESGADIIEIGMPFSDPMADGPAIQYASERALDGGQTMIKTLDMVRAIRKQNPDTPLILMGYYNPIYIYGVDKFLDDAKAAGADGFIVVDLPPEADDELCIPALDKGLHFIRLLTPTTDDKRLPQVLNNASGFLYYVSIAGVTGTKAPDLKAVKDNIDRIKKQTDLPIAIGFGVNSPAQVSELATFADGVVVGSAIVRHIEAHVKDSAKEPAGKLVETIGQFTEQLSKATKAV